MADQVSDEELRANRQSLMNIISDTFGNLIYYDRKGCETLPLDRIEMLVDRGVVTPEEIAAEFTAHVLQYFKKRKKPS